MLLCQKTLTKFPLIVFENVSMAYQGAQEPSIEHVSFTANPGETIGIIGGTGSGKSTLVHLIPRFYDVTEGTVTVDGQNVQSYPLEVLRSKVGIVMQKAVLFKGSIRDNLLWGNENATEEELMEALEPSPLNLLKKNRMASIPLWNRADGTFPVVRNSV